MLMKGLQRKKKLTHVMRKVLDEGARKVTCYKDKT